MSAHHGYLGKVDGVGDAQLGEDVLHPVHDRDEGLHARVAGHDEVGVVWRELQLTEEVVHNTRLIHVTGLWLHGTTINTVS